MTTAGNGNERVHLAALIQARIDRGDSLRDIQMRAQEAGYDISHSYVENLRRASVQRAPQRSHLAALAAGLGIPLERVHRAMIRDYYGWDPGENNEELPEDVQDVLDGVRLRLLRVATEEARKPIVREFWRIIAGHPD